MKKLTKRIYSILAFTGLWLVPFVYIIISQAFPTVETKTLVIISLILVAWTSFNNFWTIACEGKQLDEIGIGDGLMIDTGLKKESAQKRVAMYPKVPPELLSKEPEGIILGKYKERYVRIPLKDIYHYCILGGSGSGKTSTVLLDTLLANFATGRNAFQTFCIDIKGEISQKSTFAYDENVLIVDPSDRTTVGWDVYYRLHDNPSDDLIIEAIEEVSQALIISTNPKDNFFVENARTMFTGLLVYYFKQGESFIDSVNKILESEIKSLIAEIIKNSEPSDLHYKYLAKFAGKDAESVEDCMVELTTSLSVFSKSDIKFCFRDNYQKASPYSFKEGKSVFLAIPEYMLESYKAIMRLCTVQTLKELERRSEEETTPMLLIIDEFARLGRMEGIFNALATLRSKKVMVMLAFQSLAQCEVIYSKAESRVLMENCRIKAICECSDDESSKTISGWCGKYRDKKETLNGGKNQHKSYTYEDKSIVEPADLITLVKKEEEILVVSGIGYLRPKKCYYFKDEKLKALADKVKAHNKQIEVQTDGR
ncbi:type IV secretory system conjugative DNA transfer family protein [Clostridium sp. AF18-27]|uniref:type IV secretory system conjugative DNA transfer family protein n=1 Tax=Enterocloster lavalensis TaxID=460384 RepID=UPI000E530BF0|nr:type IV secretory system conjugative DNA transfer family protein [Enterocloster lavalensis]RHR44642.1 type IV secretory system conjugative DNA transfer family protein [Clostridium sp. AF18-27]